MTFRPPFLIFALTWTVLATAGASDVNTGADLPTPKTIFDSNCEPFAKKKGYFRGTLDATQRTERHFVYDKIVPGYQAVIQEVDAGLRSKTPPSPDCYAFTRPIDQCLGFQAYCTELVTSASIREDLNKWQEMVLNCSNEKYFARYPQHCSRDVVKDLLYVRDMAHQIGRIARKKSPETARFFELAYAEFAALADRMDDLIQKKKDEFQNQIAFNQSKKFIQQCEGVVARDDNDVKNRGVVGRVRESLCENCDAEQKAKSDTTGAAALERELDEIYQAVNIEKIGHQAQQTGFENSVMALWAAQERFYGPIEAEGPTTEIEQALKLVCDVSPQACPQLTISVPDRSVNPPKNRKRGEMLYERYRRSLKYGRVDVLSTEDVDNALNLSVNPQIAKLNFSCKTASGQISKANAEKDNACRGINDYSSTADTIACADAMVKHTQEVGAARAAFEQVRAESLTEIYSSSIGPLFLTPVFEEKVGALNPQIIEKNCLSGESLDPKLLKPVTQDIALKGMSDFEKLTQNEVNRIAGSFGTNQDRREMIKDYLLTHPETIADLLRRYPDPDTAKTLCTLIREIHRSDIRRDRTEKIVGGVSFVVGGAFVLAASSTGVGAVFVPALVAASGATTAVSVGMALSEKAQIRKLQERTRGAGVTGQLDLSYALNDLRKYEAEQQTLSQHIILTFGSEIAGLGMARLAKIISRLPRARAIGQLLGRSGDLTTAELKSIRAGLMRYEEIAGWTGVDSLLTRSLTQEELIQAGALFSRLSTGDATTLIRALKETGDPEALRALLFTVSKEPQAFIVGGKVRVDKLTVAVRGGEHLTLPDGTNIARLTAEVDGTIDGWRAMQKEFHGAGKESFDILDEGVLVERSTASAKKIGRAVRDKWRGYLDYRAETTFQFSKDPRINKALRYFVKKNEGRKWDWLFSPVETAISQSVRRGAKIIGKESKFGFALGSLLGVATFKYMAYDGFINSKAEEKNKALVETAIRNVNEKGITIPGGTATIELINSGLLSPVVAQSVLKKHDEEFAAWLRGKRASTSRIDALSSSLGLNPEEKKALAELVRNIFRETLTAAHEGKLTESEDKKPSKPSLEELVLVDLITTAQLAEEIEKNPAFHRLSKGQKALLASAHHPVIPIGKDTDVSILAKVHASRDSELSALRDAAEQGLPESKVLLLAYEVMKGTSHFRGEKSKKWESMKDDLPAIVESSITRPDLPDARRTLGIRTKPGGSAITVTDELDRWKVIHTDSRFSDLAQAHVQGTRSDYEILLEFDSTVEDLETLYTVIENRGSAKDLTSVGVQAALNTRFLSQVASDIETVQESLQLTPATRQKLEKDAVNLWLDYQQEVADGKAADLESYSKRYQALIEAVIPPLSKTEKPSSAKE